MASPLTAGFCSLVHSQPETPVDVYPTLQVLSVKRINAPTAQTATDRFR
jgi:hypothetical protein